MERKHSYLINKGHIGEPFVTLLWRLFSVLAYMRHDWDN